jgi:hypothetical protein
MGGDKNFTESQISNIIENKFKKIKYEEPQF